MSSPPRGEDDAATEEDNNVEMDLDTTAIGAIILDVLTELARTNVLEMGNLQALGEGLVQSLDKDAADEALLSLLQDALIACREPSAEALDKVDEVWELFSQKPKRKKGGKTPVNLREVEEEAVRLPLVEAATPKLLVWRGDITRLAVDVIVNAANDDGLGCFTPGHACVDNVVHRAAGPRLRAECLAMMRARVGGFGSLKAGSPPLLTRGYRLPARFVAHVTGPCLALEQPAPTKRDVALLRKSYESCLDAALKAGARSIAFPCLSTGVFRFPSDLACEVALGAVTDWFYEQVTKETTQGGPDDDAGDAAASGGETHEQEEESERVLDPVKAAAIEYVVFDVFADADADAYDEVYQTLERRLTLDLNEPLAARWLAEADAVLVSAGKKPLLAQHQRVYSNRRDFARHYEFLLPYGLETAASSLSRVPDDLRRAYWLRHAHNVRYEFSPNPAYATLREKLSTKKNVFVLDASAAGCFARAGFEHVYTPHGDFGWQQCGVPCARDSVWPALPALEAILPHANDLRDDTTKRCPSCGAFFKPNVRHDVGDDTFTHAPYDSRQRDFLKWLEDLSARNVVVLELGVDADAAFDARAAVEAIVREHANFKLVRVHSSDWGVPDDLRHADKAAELPLAWNKSLERLFSDEDNADGRSVALKKALVDAVRRPVTDDTDASSSLDWRAAFEALRRTTTNVSSPPRATSLVQLPPLPPRVAISRT